MFSASCPDRTRQPASSSDKIQHRHVFHLELTEPTPDRWASQEAHDGEQEPTRFECFWIPLEAAHVLQSGQGALLGRLYD
ncbi:hypothetical protein ACFY9A_37820 [Streptomyces rubradiris]|uniref:hypothetical protein n=1 Tax=Streptomyces rubradiris TaxID=285531 RepID=UPI0036E27679